METDKNVPITEIMVHTTKDYSLFKTINGNRDVNQLHLTRLSESFKKRHLITIIIVNERFEIIDGQHRFLVSKELNLPVYYTILRNYGLNEVQILNANTKNWRLEDYVNGYCDLGNKNYITYRDFVKYYGFQNQIAMLLLGGEYLRGNGTMSPAVKFKDGLFKIQSLREANETAEKILMLEPFYKGYRRRSFIIAFYGILKNKEFDFKDFLLKLKKQPLKLKDCTNVSQYKEIIEEIYNHRRSVKVNLRF